jgi:hypothetical protein
MAPLLSVVLPTHNRARYAVHALRSLLAIQDRRLEIVVSDTSSDGELSAFLEKDSNAMLLDSRLRYFRPRERLDMTGNHNAAIEQASGQFVCLIGDDDSITSEALLAAGWAADNAVDLIAPNVVANYAWPDFESRYLGKRHASRVYFSKHIGGVQVRHSEEALLAALATAVQGTEGLPKIYHGIVRRSLLEKLRAISGSYFHGSSPDVSGAVGLALCSSTFLVVDYPLTVPGASGGSNTGRSAMNRHKGDLSKESQTRAFNGSYWTPGVPRFFSVETVWAHAALETLARIAPEKVEVFNFARLIAVCRVLHPEYRVDIDRAMIEAAALVRSNKSMFQRHVNHEIRRFKFARLVRLLRRLQRPTAAGGRNYIDGVSNIAAASAAVSHYLRARGYRWDKVVSRMTD